jgi:hypothetical protein
MPSKSNDIPQSGKGTNADRGSKSPLEIRRSSADPTDVDDSPLNLGFDDRGYDDNPGTPRGPVETPGLATTPATERLRSDGRDRTPDAHSDERRSVVAPRHQHLAGRPITVKDATTNQSVTMRLAVISVGGQLTIVAVGPGSS